MQRKAFVDQESNSTHDLNQRAQCMRAPAIRPGGATYSITWGVCGGVGAISKICRSTDDTSPECFVCSYAHLRRDCPLLRCPICLDWGHNASKCPSKTDRPPQPRRLAPSPIQLKRAEALLFNPNGHNVTANLTMQN